MTELKHILDTNSFYNDIAEQYNSNMTERDAHTRQIVRQIFELYVKKGHVLDFGAGTGMDLAWLAANKKYIVTALEPSIGMREIAKNTLAGNILFIETNTDFRFWTEDHLPFQRKMDGILANFAVLNHIKDLSLLFEKLILVSNDGCVIVALVLDASFASMCKAYSPMFALKNISKNTITVLNKHNGGLRETFLHNVNSIRTAAHPHFKVLSYKHIPGTEFAILLLNTV